MQILILCLCVHIATAFGPFLAQKPRVAQREKPEGNIQAAVASAALAASLAGFPLVALPPTAFAVSGGGLDYAEQTLSGQDFSKGKFKAKDFSGAIALDVPFRGSDLRGARFFKANLAGADFTGANLGAASLEGANLEGSVMTNAVLENTYFSETVAKVGDISGADFSGALMRPDIQAGLCGRPDAKGTNPTTGVETRESLMCD